MSSSLTDPKQWALPNPARVLAALHAGAADSPAGTSRNSSWVLSSAISPVDLYAYLRFRFGPPNGLAMTLRAPSVDNLIHWHYTLECPDTVLDLTGLSVRIEVLSYSAQASVTDWKQMEKALQTEIAAHRRVIEETKRTFEKWRLFLNPYRRLSQVVHRCEEELQEIELHEVQPPPIPATREQARCFCEDMANATRLYEKAMQLCVTLDVVVPILGEAAVNLIMLILAKPEIRNDKRMRDELGRRAIDVRIKSLPLLCAGFEQPIVGSEHEFRNFLRVMNERNDTLHGNVDPGKSLGEEIFFDLRTIPLLKTQHTFGQVALANALSSISTRATLDKVNVVRAFVAFLLSRLQASHREAVELAMESMHLGYRPETGTIGAILPAVQFEAIPVVESDQEGDE